MPPPRARNICLVSACLVGLCTRYDGQVKENRNCLKRLDNFTWIPVCPEQLGGLATPRDPADLVGGDGTSVLAGKARVITRTGIEVTEQFVRGANQVLDLATEQGITTIFLKAGSPSCGVGGTLGVTAALLQKHGLHLEEF